MDTMLAPFLLIDLGYPMTINTLNIVKKSLQNVLSLASASPNVFRVFNFGISVIGSDFEIILFTSNTPENYSLIAEKVDGLHSNFKNSNKTTVDEYKNLLCMCIEKIIRGCQTEIETIHQSFRKDPFSPQQRPQIELTVITKKTASLIGKMLIHAGHNYHDSIKKFIVIQILKEDLEPNINHMSISNVKCFTCPPTLFHLNCLLKNWILKPVSKQTQLRIVPFGNNGLQCYIDDCIINPSCLPFEQKFYLSNKITTIMKNIPSLDPSSKMYELEILYRIPLTGMHSSLIYGTPHRLIAARPDTLNHNESSLNLQIFKELCQHLVETGQGLLTKFKFHYDIKRMNIYYFVTSYGETLLLTNVVPEELYLPNKQIFEFSFKTDENATYLVKNSLKNIEFLEEYSPSKFTSGLYEILQNHLIHSAQTSNFVKLNDKKCKTEKLDINPNKIKFSSSSKTKRNQCIVKKREQVTSQNLHNHSQSKKRAVVHSELELINVHPALLSPKTIQKYRNVSSELFNLPELGESYST